MKATRVALIGIGVLALVLVVAVILALNSSVQTWAARRALNQSTEVKGTVGRVSAGFQSVDVTALRVESNGAVLTVPELNAELPLIAAGLHKQVAVKRLVAKGWTLDLTNASAVALDHGRAPQGADRTGPAAASFSLLSSAVAAEPPSPSPAKTAAAAFHGVLIDLQLPVDLSLDGVELEGDVLMQVANPNGAKETIRAHVKLNGGGLAVGQEGHFPVEATAVKPDGSQLAVHATLSAKMDTPRTFVSAAVKGNASATATEIPNGVSVDFDAAVVRQAPGEKYSVSLLRGPKQLAMIEAAFISDTAKIAGTWKVDLHDEDVVQFVLGRTLPAFAAAGEGSFESSTAESEIHAVGRLKGSVNRLEALRSELSAIGASNFTADFDVLLHGESLRVDKLDATVAGTAPVVVIRALQPFEFNLKTAGLNVADPAKDLVSVTLAGVPVAWAAPFLSGYSLTGGDIRGEIAASARNDGLALRVRSPVTVGGVSLAQAGKPLLQEVDVTLNASADYTPAGWQAQIVELGLRRKGAALLVLDAKAGRLHGETATKATGRWSADLPGWTTQPLLADQLQLSSGVAQGDFSASMDGTQSIQANVALSNLAAPAKEKLPAISAEIRADVAPNGTATFKVPLVFTQGDRKSDLLIAGTFTPGKPAATIDAKLTSQQVFVDDVKLLGGLLPGQGSAPKDKSAPKPGEPFWNGITGQVTLALKKVVYGGTFEVSDVGGTLRLEPAALTLDGVRAIFGAESDLKVAADVKFDPKSERSYAVAADVALNNFDAGPAFRAIDPTKPPTIEGKVNLNGHFTGEGVDLAQATERAKGKFDLTSKGGIFRGLQTVIGPKLSTTQTALATVSGLFGGTTLGDYSNVALEITKAFAEIPFDQLSVKAERDTNLNFLLQDFTLISPELRLLGAGKVIYNPGKPLLNQALDLQMTIAARGKPGQLLGKIKMLKPEKDNLGYSVVTAPIKISGTLMSPDNADFGLKIANAIAENFGIKLPW